MKQLVMSFILIASVSACSTTGQRIDELARRAGLAKTVVEGAGDRHTIYMRAPTPAGRLFVFLDGDGRPWDRYGRKPSEDPTTRNPVALKLLEASAGGGAYVSRPCYQQLLDERCTAELW